MEAEEEEQEELVDRWKGIKTRETRVLERRDENRWMGRGMEGGSKGGKKRKMVWMRGK